MLQNIKFGYLYRDASNYKMWGEVIFTNPDGIALDYINNRLKLAFDFKAYFIADQINIEEVFFEDITDDDHCYHEFYSVEFTEKKGTDPLNRTITSFLKQVELESLQGWRAFDPVIRDLIGIVSI